MNGHSVAHAPPSLLPDPSRGPESSSEATTDSALVFNIRASKVRHCCRATLSQLYGARTPTVRSSLSFASRFVRRRSVLSMLGTQPS